MDKKSKKKKGNKKLPFISIIICAYNEAKTLPTCLDSLLALDYPNYELILVDDVSTDNSLQIMKQYEKKHKKIKVVTYPINKGVPGARNAGMKAAKGDIFVFSDADAKFYPWWPSRLIKPIIDNKKIGATGGRDKLPPNQPLLMKCVDYTMTSFIGTGGLRGAKVRLARYSFTGCNFAVKREVVEKVGMHDEKIRWRGEEKEWAQRIREGGYDIKFVPDSYMLHYRRIDLKSFWRQTYKSGKARFDILKAAKKSFQLVHALPSLFVMYLVLTGLFSLISKISLFSFLMGIGVYLFVLLVQNIIGTIRVRNILAFFIIPVTTIVMHFAYGLGLIHKFLFD